MREIALGRAAVMAEGLLLAGDPGLTVTSVHFDTRQLLPGALFVAIAGTRDGHDFLLQAAEKGARAAIISNEQKVPDSLPAGFGLILVNDTLRAFQKLAAAYRTSFSIPFVAITGSNGKTTTKDIVAHLLESRFSIHKTYKNLNNHLGVPYSLLQVEEQHQAAVLELGMNHAGEIDLLASLVKPQISVITYIGEAHIEFFGSREKIALAKAELLPHTDPDGLVLLNGDSEYLRKVAPLYPGRIMYYSVNAPADIWAENIQSADDGTRFDVCFRDGERFAAFLPLFGTHNVLNALPAVAIGRHFGMTTAEIIRALATVRLSAMRFERIESAHGPLYINDAYNASPSSMEAAISTFAELFPERKKVLVLGDMFELGENSPAMHAQVGAFANRYRDRIELLVAVGEQAQHLYDAYEGNKRYFPTKADAVETLLALRDAHHAFLFKASQGMGLWTLLQALEDHA
ncbi:UDP-N-acetylmuramoyl-tripeptide--D-alanyl-D-alanine ligase [Brevibacillus sp. MCWH]|uniref:UDP-N-acetylmuramoyl-tripeptide--D-alanyl-D- alanine ligase n=1 Tax=Brevibacillus sp. MCWH TaxID=2508871 RepID=UPI000E3B4521|nr:UDP-N-acetylmuramoyl-tripeptide--D-alanyl-D-alanine ligase [Brevibacillus sp. MCWH]NNV02452.1 UDP-N-acetylmuramoyl-tripeptide--D-alanyl-D-alanine ligase [Brevibacillus sp. MCWH]REK64654.1 MAG: UDP-N-acetylmuramoyl-tripeptide--D-alanyl-D-alanine ligase [Brevibacillus sp.]